MFTIFNLDSVSFSKPGYFGAWDGACMTNYDTVLAFANKLLRLGIHEAYFLYNYR